MSSTTSFAPLAERLTVFAGEIRSDIDGQDAMARILGLCWIAILHCLVRLCLALDKRAEVDAREAMVVREDGVVPVAPPRNPSPAALPRFALRLAPARLDHAAEAPVLEVQA